MIGTQNQYYKSAEVDIFEILGKDIYNKKSKVWVTVHPWYDTVIRTQRLNYWVDTDISADYHTYGFEWLPTGMKWYFDGKLVRETTQSPDYKMYTLLGIYQSWGGLFSWQGPVDESQPYPKSFDIDYFRVYKTKELIAADKEELQKEADLIREHPEAAAIFGGDFSWDWYHQPGHLNDGQMNTTLQSKNNITLPVHIYADFKEARKLRGMEIYTHYGQGQGITDFTVEYKDFDDSWKEIARVKDHKWEKNSSAMEMLSVPFDRPVASAEFRIKVLKANLWWKHFAINEIKFLK